MGGPAVSRTSQTTHPGTGTAFSYENSGTCKLCIIILKGLLQPLGYGAIMSKLWKNWHHFDVWGRELGVESLTLGLAFTLQKH